MVLHLEPGWKVLDPSANRFGGNHSLLLRERVGTYSSSVPDHPHPLSTIASLPEPVYPTLTPVSRSAMLEGQFEPVHRSTSGEFKTDATLGLANDQQSF